MTNKVKDAIDNLILNTKSLPNNAFQQLLHHQEDKSISLTMEAIYEGLTLDKLYTAIKYMEALTYEEGPYVEELSDSIEEAKILREIKFLQKNPIKYYKQEYAPQFEKIVFENYDYMNEEFIKEYSHKLQHYLTNCNCTVEDPTDIVRGLIVNQDILLSTLDGETLQAVENFIKNSQAPRYKNYEVMESLDRLCKLIKEYETKNILDTLYIKLNITPHLYINKYTLSPNTIIDAILRAFELEMYECYPESYCFDKVSIGRIKEMFMLLGERMVINICEQVLKLSMNMTHNKAMTSRPVNMNYSVIMHRLDCVESMAFDTKGYLRETTDGVYIKNLDEVLDKGWPIISEMFDVTKTATKGKFEVFCPYKYEEEISNFLWDYHISKMFTDTDGYIKLEFITTPLVDANDIPKTDTRPLAGAYWNGTEIKISPKYLIYILSGVMVGCSTEAIDNLKGTNAIISTPRYFSEYLKRMS